MTRWLVASGVLMVVGLAPGLLLAGRGTAAARLVGVQFATAATVLVMLTLAQSAGQTSYLIVPLVLVPLAAAGTLVFTRLLGRGP